MKRFFLLGLLGVLMLVLVGCSQASSGTGAGPAAVPGATATSQTFLPAVGQSGAVTQTLTPRTYMPLMGGAGAECTAYTASMTLSATATTVKVGDVVTVTATLANQGCVALGLPQYRLAIQPAGAQPPFDPPNPEPVVHNLGVGIGQSDKADFTLRAVAPGQATLSATTSFEVHYGYPGPATWGGAAAAPLVVNVTQ